VLTAFVADKITVATVAARPVTAQHAASRARAKDRALPTRPFEESQAACAPSLGMMAGSILGVAGAASRQSRASVTEEAG